MQSPNKRPQTAAERRHVARVKLLPCALCGDGGGDMAPSEAHEIRQGLWFTSIPLCADCHRGEHNGIHGRQHMWKAYKEDELSLLDKTLGRLLAG